jgi:hypothetical protein
VTIAVDPQDAVVLNWALDSRLPMTFALRSVQYGLGTEGADPDTQAVTLAYMIDNYGVALPDRLPYGLEPAIRSVRRLITGDQLNFGEGQPGAPGQ